MNALKIVQEEVAERPASNIVASRATITRYENTVDLRSLRADSRVRKGIPP